MSIRKIFAKSKQIAFVVTVGSVLMSSVFILDASAAFDWGGVVGDAVGGVAGGGAAGDAIGDVVGGALSGTNQTYTVKYQAQGNSREACIENAKKGANDAAKQACEAARDKNITRGCRAAGEPVVTIEPVSQDTAPTHQNFKGEFNQYFYTESESDCMKKTAEGAINNAREKCLTAGYAGCDVVAQPNVQCYPVTQGWLRKKGYRMYGSGSAFVSPGAAGSGHRLERLFDCEAQATYRPGAKIRF